MRRIIIVAVVGVVVLSGCTVQFESSGVPDGSEPSGSSEPESESDLGTFDPEPYPTESEPEFSEEPEPEPSEEPDGGSVTVDSDITGARDEVAAILQGWDSSFVKPPIVFYDDELTVGGESFDADSAAWYDGKIYLDPDTIYDYDTVGNLHYTIGHEMGHGWEEHYDPYYPVSRSSELYADCMAGAIAVAAGWDVDGMADYTQNYLGEDDLHGDGDDRYEALMTGAGGGRQACSH